MPKAKSLTIHYAVDHLAKLYDLARADPGVSYVSNDEAYTHWLAVYCFLGQIQDYANELMRAAYDMETAIDELKQLMEEEE